MLIEKQTKTQQEVMSKKEFFFGFQTRLGMQAHLAIHSNLREFKCKECDASFNQQSELINHGNWKHTQGNPHRYVQYANGLINLPL